MLGLMLRALWAAILLAHTSVASERVYQNGVGLPAHSHVRNLSTGDAAGQNVVVSSCSPASGPISGGTWVSLVGSGMQNGEDSLHCRFGDSAPVPAFWISDTAIQCVAPPVESPGLVNVTLSNDGVDSTSGSVEFLYYEHPIASKIHPTFGDSNGGTPVEMHGAFPSSSDVVCRFGSSYFVDAVFASEEKIVCHSPPGITGTSDPLSISLNGVDFSPSLADFYYKALPEVHSVKPKWADEAGGTPLIVAGSNFEDTDDLACRFERSHVDSIGGVERNSLAIEAEYVSPTEVRCQTPPMAAHTNLIVRVTTNAVDVSSSGAHLEYVARAVVSEMHPTRGSIAGGTLVTLVGSGFLFEDTITCRFGDAAVPAEFVTWTMVRCDSPPSSVGDAVVSYSNDGLNFVNATDNPVFSYAIPATVAGMEPSAGSKRGGTEVHILGDGFVNETGWQCLFNETSVPAVSWSPSEMSCLAPAWSVGASSLKLVEPDGSVVETGLLFRYYEDLRLVSMFPESAPITGGTKVAIELTGMQIDTSYACVFGEEASPATILNGSFVECASPRWAAAEEASLVITATLPFAIATEAVPFAFYEPPGITSAYPMSFYSEFSTDFLVRGGPFFKSAHMKCRLGTLEVEARWVSEAEVACRYESRSIEPHTRELPLFVSLNGVDYDDSGIVLRVHHGLTVSDISPTFGSASGGTRVRVNGTGFADSFAYRCMFGSQFVGADYLSRNELLCNAAPFYLPGSKSIWVCVDGGDCVGREGLVFDYLDPLQLLDVSPTEGPLAGGTLVHIESNHPFGASSVCSFGSQHVEIEVSDASTNAGTCQSPQYDGESKSPATVDFSISANGQEYSRERFQFVYRDDEGIVAAALLAKAHISHISPDLGIVGTNVTVHGSGFEHLEDVACRFGGLVQVPATVVSNSSLACAAPWNAKAPESVRFDVAEMTKTADIYYGNNEISFTYVEPPQLTGVDPTAVVKTNESISLDIEGHNLDLLARDAVQCRVGLSVAPAVFDDAIRKIRVEQIIVGEEAGSFRVELLSEQYGAISSSRAKLRVIEQHRLSHLEPAIVASPDRPMDIMIKGENFSEHNLTCHLDDQPSTMVAFLSHSEILCRLPKHIRPGAYKVRVSNGGTTLHRAPYLTLEVVSPPSIAALSPSVGQAGSNVTITGKAFHPRMKCAFGSQIAETFFVNSTLVQCTAPPAMSRVSVPVEFTLDSRPISFEPPVLFTFIDLTLSAISPSFGDVNGGTRVSFNLKEESVESVSHCRFGDDIVTAMAEQPGVVVCLSPPAQEEGPVTVGVSVDGSTFSTSQLVFEYTKEAVFFSIDPTSVPESGGTIVVLTGEGFVKSAIKCFFGEVESPGRWISGENVFCETPALQPGAHQIGISFNGIDTLATNQSFEVYPRMTALHARPSFGATRGNTSILVHGTNFRREDALACRFEGSSTAVVVDASHIASNLLECTTPKWDAAESVTLEVVADTGETTVAESGFTFYTPFDLSAIHPDHGFLRGGINVTVKGDHFSDALGPVNCLFEQTPVEAEVISANEILCTAPLALSSGGVDFALSYGSDVFGLPHQAFEYEDEMVLGSLYPSVVPSTTDKTITVYGSLFKNRAELGCRISSDQMSAEAFETQVTFVSDDQLLCRIPQGLRPGTYSLSITTNGQDFAESLDFSIIDPLLVKSIQPTMGSPDTVHVILLEGNAFRYLDGLTCLVDDKYIVPSRFVNATSIQCSLPVNVNAGNVSVALALDGVPISTGPPLLFTYVDLSLSSIWPPFGDLSGGTRVTFELKETSPSVVSHCTFGDELVPARIHESELICVSPPTQREGPVRIGVSVDGRAVSRSHLAFEYTKAALFDEIHPRSGPETGGTVVKLTGSNFVNSNTIKCFFGGTEALGRWLSEDKLSCTAPAMRPGNYKLRLTLNGVDTLRTPWQFASFQEIDVLYASPSSGSLLGGTEISLVGKSFVATDDMLCRFGRLGSSPAAFVSSTEVTCITPDASNDVDEVTEVGVSVSLNVGVDFSAAAARFHFTPPAVVHSIFPAQGSVNGGTEVHVFGSNMLPSITSDTASCIFGSVMIPALVLSNEELTCVSPPHSNEGAVFFAISLNGVDLVRGGRTAFLYTPNVQTVSIHPNGGPFTGGTLVTVTGAFEQSASLRCKFGELYSDAVYLSDQTVQCKAPMHPPGTVDFVVVAEGDDIVPSETVFEFYQPPVILFNNPTSGPHYGETVVRIYGHGFRSNVDYVCYFGDSASIAGQFVATDAIECPSPRIAPEDAQTSVELVVAEKHSNFTANKLHFSYLPPPSLDHLLPRHVFPDGGDVLSVYGSHMNTTEAAWCQFLLPSKTDGSLYYETVQASPVSDDGHVECVVPEYPLESSHMVDGFVQVSTNGMDWSDSRLIFSYVQKPRVESISPSLGSFNGGTRVAIRGSHFLQEGNLWCAFGREGSVPAKWVSSTEIVCSSPPASYPANVALSLQFEGNRAVIDGAHFFSYHRELSLEEASPMRGFVSGGTVVTVTGTGLLDVPAIFCRFAQSGVVLATLVSPNALTCTSPPVNHAHDVELEVSLNGADWVGLPQSSAKQNLFTYDAEVDLFRTIPANVPIASDIDDAEPRFITVIGASFVNTTSLACIFGEQDATSAEFVSASEVTCTLPKVTEVGEVDVRLSLNGIDVSNKKTSLAFVWPALISSVSPNTIQEGSEVDLLIGGENFLHSANLQCHFGASEAWSPARWISSSSLRCTTPPLNLTHDGVEYIGVSNNGGHDVADLWLGTGGHWAGRELFALGVTSRAQFISMEPAVGYILGGAEVTIALGNVKYMPELTCQFGSEAVPAILSSANSIVCESPPYHPGSVALKLVSEGAHYIGAGTFEYLVPPLLKSLEPATGPLEGTAVTIAGSGLTGVTHCRFSYGDNSYAVAATLVDDSNLKCDAPQVDEAIEASVEVSHNYRDYVGAGLTFRYRARPRLLSLEPSYGSDLGGKAIHVAGEHFHDAPALHCRFGAHLVNAIYISQTSLICHSPPLTIEPVPVSVLVDGVESIETLVYTPIKLPQVKSTEPIRGTVSGNTTVVLHTTALHAQQRIECLFGDSAVPASYLSSNSVSCVAPKVDAPGVVSVSVSVDGERGVANGQQFEYVSQPQVTSVYPSFGRTTGGGTISLSAKDLTPWINGEVSCDFGQSNNFTRALQVGETLVTCQLPPFHEDSMQQHAPILLRVGNGPNALHIETPAFSYLEPAEVTDVEPTVGSIRGGSLVRVSGTGFTSMSGLQCLFGTQAVDAEFVDRDEIACVAPSWRGGPKRVEVHIGRSGGEKLSLASRATFTYLPHPAIESIRPRFGTIDGGTNVTLALGNAHSWTESADHLSCRFGNSTLVPVVSAKEEEVACASPPVNEAAISSGRGRATPVQVSLYQGQLWLASADERFTYADHIEVGELSPDSGPLQGGTVVALSAKDLHHLPIDDITCHFGRNSVSATYDEEEDVLQCVSPPLDNETSTKAVLLNLGIGGARDVLSMGQLYTYYPAPSVTSVSPALGFLEGGEDVLVEGRNFRKEGLGCVFGTVPSPKVAWLSDSAIICTSPVSDASLNATGVAIRVTDNGVDFTDGSSSSQYVYVHRPDASRVEPQLVRWEESTNITIAGKDLTHVSGCRFGLVNETHPAFNVTSNGISCQVPPATAASLSLLPSLAESKVHISLVLENGLIATGLKVTYVEPPPKEPEEVSQPAIASITPTRGSSAGGDLVQVVGSGFLNTLDLACIFGNSMGQDAQFISADEIRCRTPRHIPGRVSFSVTNGGGLRSNQVDYTFVSDSSITTIFPASGSVKGATDVRVYGSFPPSLFNSSEVSTKCRFGTGGVVNGELVSQNEVKCLSPPSTVPEAVEVRLSFDGGLNYGRSSAWFSYEQEGKIESLVPNYGYHTGGTSVVLVGSNFRNATNLACLFDDTRVAATFFSANKVSCVAPPMETETKVAVRLASAGEIGSSWKYFEYLERPQLLSFSPVLDSSSGGATVAVTGSGFRSVLQLHCFFGNVRVRATVIDASELLCKVPRHHPGAVNFGIVDQYALLAITPLGDTESFRYVPETSVHGIHSTYNVTEGGTIVFARGTNFNASEGIACSFGSATTSATVLSDSLLSCPSPFDEWKNGTEVRIGLPGSSEVFQPPIEVVASSPAAPNGTTMSANVTLCEPGTFQPQAGQEHCLPCPVGHSCPLHGMSKPQLCPAGFICDRLGLVVPSSPCIVGHSCNEGTKMSSPSTETSRETAEFELDEETGVLTAVTTNSRWEPVQRFAPATGERQIAHPPLHASVKAEQPFSCPLGFWCSEGVSTTDHREGDYSTPQPCYPGYFCSRGSTTPEGAGACPSGYFCDTPTLAVPCPRGFHCPGTANTHPAPCYPGTYASQEGQSTCSLCGLGFQCPGFERIAPEPCDAGWVCDEEGLSIPHKRCPAGYICHEGTTTDDPTSLFGVPPLPCPAGAFCLEGVAHNDTSDWLPSFELGALAPQPCQEGYWCPSGSATPIGDGKCLPGHFCEEGSDYPIQTPPGAFFGDEGGAIVGSLCLPGTFSPRPGQIECVPCPSGSECITYGTSIPRICGPGTYRSKSDATQCKPCPERTYSSASGLADISQCLPCAEGRVCGSEGMADLQQSDACSEGVVCGYMTDRVDQFAHQCPSGGSCSDGTTTLNQYAVDCQSGFHCERGTTSQLSTRDKCAKSHWCASGTPNPEPFITRCPRQTTSLAGSEFMDHCSPSLVTICDKAPFSDANPFDELRFYPLEQPTSEDEEEESVEMLVVKKILPFSEEASNVQYWKNDTVEVLRTCPTYRVLPEDNSAGSKDETAVTIIGRNFRNSTTLTCRYRICLDMRWQTDDNVTVVSPGPCRDGASNTSEPITKEGSFVSDTRITCPLPGFDDEDTSQPLNDTRARGPFEELCLRDDEGHLFLSQACSSSDLASGHCAFEEAIPSFGLRKRVYSLVLPCSDAEVSGGLCDDVPAASSKLNPCLSQRVIVDVSNSGKKFSGDSTVVPYTSLELDGGGSLDEGNSYYVPPTQASIHLVPHEHLDALQVDSSVVEKKHLASNIESDSILCQRASIGEEGTRLAEEGWFQAPYMSRLHLSFDWRHLPSHLVYDEHFKLAIYVVPSRCQETTCGEAGRGHRYMESVPCLQPVELPAWFTDDSIDKHQVMNMTLTSLDDSRFRVEVQVVNGLALTAADFFQQTMTVVMDEPQRANTLRSEKRNVSPLVSFEEEAVDMSYFFGVRYDNSHSSQVSLPRNLPPRWKSFERGRVLVGMNTTHENEAPTIKDGQPTEGIDYWESPHHTALVAKQQSDLYRETFHGLSIDRLDRSYQYEHESLILPYLPYFSNCREFDSHVPLWALVESASQCQLPGATEDFPENWWRRDIPALPHQDDVRAIGPSDFIQFYPIADWCERKLHCSFEEDLPKPDVTPRWFEAEAGTALFSIIRDPIDYHQYTGRDASTAGNNDGGGQRYIDSIDTLQTFIPAKVDRSPAFNVEGGCTTNCYPRKVTVDVSYQQVDVHSKRIVQVKVLYDKFDKDASNDRYELQVKFYALNYQELVIKFAFSRGLFLLLFSQIGVGTVVAAFIYWIVVRLTTNLERPPSLRITGFLWLTFPSALGGFLLGLLPISLVTSMVYYLMKGYLIFADDTDPDGRRWFFPSSTRLHYSDVDIDPDNLQSTRQGRTGLAFVTMALISLYFTCRMFVPKHKPSNDEDGANRALVSWKRGNLICSSVLMSLFLVVIVEWSFWGSFGTYIWEAIIFIKVLSIFVGSAVDRQLGEALLSAPVMTAMGLVQGIVTMSANDFMDFLLSYIVGFGFLILERMYVGPLQADVFGWAYGVCNAGAERLRNHFPSVFGASQEASCELQGSMQLEENNETVEPLLGSYASYSCDALSLLYTPFIMLIIMAFRDETQIIKLYGIKEDDMEYYVLFALAIIPFQIIADILLHNALELLHGWKMREYLEYCKVRFQQREVWWKGHEINTQDECIEESLRTLDQWCFSAQYYMLLTVHVNAMIFLTLGVQTLARAKHNPFGDPATFPVVGLIVLCSLVVKFLLTFIARAFGLWRIKHEKRGWHAGVLASEGNPVDQRTMEEPAANFRHHAMEQRLTADTFRYRFLSHQRSWLLSQLPDLLSSPRTTARQRPYLINQFARILGSVDGNVSSDSDEDSLPDFDAAPMTAPSRTLARTWLEKASRRLRLKALVADTIQQAKGESCQGCLARNNLQVSTLHSIDEMDQQFIQEYRTEEIDQALFRRFWQRTQQYETLCLRCQQQRNQDEREQLLTDDRSADEPESELSSATVTASSESIMSDWYAAAKRRLQEEASG